MTNNLPTQPTAALIAYKVVKEALIVLNLVLAATLMGALIYFGAAVVHGLSELGNSPAVTTEDTSGTTGEDEVRMDEYGQCPDGMEPDYETGFCY